MTRHRITHYTHTRHGLTWHCRCGATGTSPWDDQARRDGREHEDGGGGIDLNAEYLDLSLRTRLAQPGLDLDGVGA